MNLMGIIESANRDYVFYKDEIYKPKLCVQNGLGVKKNGKYTVYMILPNGQKVFLFTDKPITVNANDTKEIILFPNGLKVTKKYPSGEYYIVAETVDLSHPKMNKVYDAFPFHIESREIFPSGQHFFKIQGKNAIPFSHLFGAGHYSAFADLTGACPNHLDFRQSLEIFKSYGVNFIRQFMLDGQGTSWNPNSNTIYPWTKVGNKFDLQQPNEQYYARLDLFLQHCEANKIIFQADMTDHYTLYKSTIWPEMPMHPTQNMQNSYGFPNKNNAFPEWYRMMFDYPQMWNVIKDYIKRVCEVMKKYEYVMYLVMNEAVSGNDNEIFQYHQAFAKEIRKHHPNSIIAGNAQHYNQNVESMVYGLKEIEVVEAHGACGCDGPPPFGNYRGEYFEQFGATLIPDEDGCWQDRTPDNSKLRIEKVFNESGRKKCILKTPWPREAGWSEWVSCFQHVKDLLNV